MNYNLKNKAVAVIALAFVFTLTMSQASLAAEENAAAATENVVSAPVPADSVDGLIQSTASAAEDASKTIDAAVDTANQATEAVKDSVQDIQNGVESMQNNVQDAAAAVQDSLDAVSLGEPSITAPEAPIDNPSPVEAAPTESPSDNDDGLDFLNNQSPDDFLSNSGPLIDAADMSALSTDDVAKLDGPVGDNPLSSEAVNASYEEFKELDKEIDKSLPEADAPKSPLEKFGNAILSKVDNNLFNQMSHIEKEATLLQLEKKREELRTKVLEERQKSLAIIEATRRAKLQLEEERKRAEAERQARILEEERKLKEKEMELEKLRQGKVINDYMNEMLMMNQKWVEKSAKLQGRIKELENERVELIDNFKAKMTTIDEEIQKTHEHAVLVVNEHQKMVEEFNKKIEDLEGTINDLKHALKESRRKLRELQDANLNASTAKAEDSEGPDKNDVDMSREYAIMDITGKGDDIVAKIINSEGKIFIVHKGSMLKNGEVVTSITDHYISFENKGVNSYLYTGNTVMEYEPEASFGDTADKISSKPKDSNAEGTDDADAQQTKKSKKDDNKKQTKPITPVKVDRNKKEPVTPKNPNVSQRVAPPPPGRGMFMK